MDEPVARYEEPKLIPARMLNEFVYCPRLCYMEWVQGEFEHSEDTLEGKFVHRNVDQEKTKDLQGEEKKIHSTSVMLSGYETGVITRIDLLEESNGKAVPVEYKKGYVPDIPEKVYEPERIQLCAQGLVLKEKGFDCTEGVIYFVNSKKRVAVDFDEELIQKTKETILRFLETIGKKEIPAPLENSPKCSRCSLSGICLPDETNILKGSASQVRSLNVSKDDKKPVYVTGWGTSVHKKGDRLVIKKNDEELQSVPLRQISQLSIYGDAHISLPVLRSLIEMNVPVCYFSFGGWFYGLSHGVMSKNVDLRIHQYQTAFDSERSLAISRKMIAGKIKNCRTLLRRNDTEVSEKILSQLNSLEKKASNAKEIGQLLGIEGTAAQIYFSRFGNMLKQDLDCKFENRNKRPPTDPVNAVLSYLYGILTKEVFVTLFSVGFDPYMGFYHQPKYGKPALALDLMEEFRPLIADSVALTLFNNKTVTLEDFEITNFGVSLKDNTKKKIISGYERRINTEITHPIFGYKASYRRILEIQVRLLGRTVTKEIESYTPFCTR
ncbi:CRISPR-associated RecB family exonuclease Cas4b [Methanosarcina barkeri str. Wiesmoor]|uniref:CRISPR-associated endonuclease Cas1 n=2 Tax=Methanosarcina barkeri TaxID=2208 RepID=A0A0E3LL93_METBA|nr:CRISPR-associated endonuclease Cas4/Cas1 [Methanosarcina barkeri]AKB50871.1 CRISPR-associated RecB family exonuclease Cas4b [Methanosarcina barkeri str. Wiesmoor]